MKLTLDVENTVTKRDGKMHLDPFEPTNKLVMVGCRTDKGVEYLYDMENDGQASVGIQELLDATTILIGHNIAYDLMWLWESGFRYDGPVFDTMLAEYILQRGIKQPLSLEACAERHDLATKKQDTLKQYFAKDMGVDEIPRAELAQYLSADLRATQQLCDMQYKRLNSTDDARLMDTVIFTNKVCLALAKIYRRGFKVDVDVLNDVKNEFEKEKQEIEDRLNKQVKEIMGDTPINLNSPEQLSWIIYSRKPKDKTTWMNNFTPYMSKEELLRNVKANSNIMYKTVAERCPVCHGTGRIKKLKKDGTPYANLPKCVNCHSLGYVFTPTTKIAGFRFNPPNVKWVSANGFSVNKKMLDVLQHMTKRTNSMKAYNFLSDIQRLSALDTYLSSFVEGIRAYTKSDGMLHVRLLQHRTATGRFSGADPNMQNVHSYTASVISDAGEETSRQEAKAHTFAPLYGATGFGRSAAQATYYKHFTDKYKEINLWHSRLAKEAIGNKKITIPSGREFSFPDVVRRGNGSVTSFTQIKNYPVQSFATADIVPLIMLEIDARLDNMQSCIVNTVHDSIVIDVHPNESSQVHEVIESVNREMKHIIDRQYQIDFNVPLLLESKIGNNWLDTK